jgi:hypothetical protein
MNSRKLYSQLFRYKSEKMPGRKAVVSVLAEKGKGVRSGAAAFVEKVCSGFSYLR